MKNVNEAKVTEKFKLGWKKQLAALIKQYEGADVENIMKVEPAAAGTKTF